MLLRDRFASPRLASLGLALVVALAASLEKSDRAASASSCSFTQGFEEIYQQAVDIVGECVEDEWHHPDSGDALQRTTRGLLVWRKADNWTAFTDGTTTWINGPLGLQSRPNAERFEWESDLVPVVAGGPPAAPPDSAVGPPFHVDFAIIPPYAEIRPENAAANRALPQLEPWQWDESQMGNKLRPYYDQISGNYQGTTEQILDWVARKWGFDRLGYPDLAKAVAWKESTWRSSFRGDHEEARYYFSPHPTFSSPDYQSYGITQVKRSVWPGSYPNSANSTAFAADYWAAVVRMAYDGQSWRGNAVKGDIWGAVQFWFNSATSNDRSYSNQVRDIYARKPWQRGGS